MKFVYYSLIFLLIFSCGSSTKSDDDIVSSSSTVTDLQSDSSLYSDTIVFIFDHTGIQNIGATRPIIPDTLLITLGKTPDCENSITCPESTVIAKLPNFNDTIIFINDDYVNLSKTKIQIRSECDIMSLDTNRDKNYTFAGEGAFVGGAEAIIQYPNIIQSSIHDTVYLSTRKSIEFCKAWKRDPSTDSLDIYEGMLILNQSNYVDTQNYFIKGYAFEDRGSRIRILDVAYNPITSSLISKESSNLVYLLYAPENGALLIDDRTENSIIYVANLDSIESEHYIDKVRLFNDSLNLKVDTVYFNSSSACGSIQPIEIINQRDELIEKGYCTVSQDENQIILNAKLKSYASSSEELSKRGLFSISSKLPFNTADTNEAELNGYCDRYIVIRHEGPQWTTDTLENVKLKIKFNEISTEYCKGFVEGYLHSYPYEYDFIYDFSFIRVDSLSGRDFIESNIDWVSDSWSNSSKD